MTLTEIKKELYKRKPLATFLHCRKIGANVCLVYGCNLADEKALPELFFEVPVVELGDGLFGNTIQAQLLIRYIVQHEITQP